MSELPDAVTQMSGCGSLVAAKVAEAIDAVTIEETMKARDIVKLLNEMK
jgi:hypothetical protein